MKELIFNDGRSLEIQSVNEESGTLKVRVILTTREVLKALFLDEFATSKMTLIENHQEKGTYENYHHPSFKEEYGGIWEVELVQKEKGTDKKIEDLQTELKSAKKDLHQTKEELNSANTQITDLQLAICELFEGKEV